MFDNHEQFHCLFCGVLKSSCFVTFHSLALTYVVILDFQFLQLHLDPASNNTLPGNGSITQTLRVTNNQHGKVDILCYYCFTLNVSVLPCVLSDLFGMLLQNCSFMLFCCHEPTIVKG